MNPILYNEYVAFPFPHSGPRRRNSGTYNCDRTKGWLIIRLADSSFTARSMAASPVQPSPPATYPRSLNYGSSQSTPIERTSPSQLSAVNTSEGVQRTSPGRQKSIQASPTSSGSSSSRRRSSAPSLAPNYETAQKAQQVSQLPRSSNLRSSMLEEIIEAAVFPVGPPPMMLSAREQTGPHASMRSNSWDSPGVPSNSAQQPFQSTTVPISSRRQDVYSPEPISPTTNREISAAQKSAYLPSSNGVQTSPLNVPITGVPIPYVPISSAPLNRSEPIIAPPASASATRVKPVNPAPHVMPPPNPFPSTAPRVVSVPPKSAKLSSPPTSPSGVSPITTLAMPHASPPSSNASPSFAPPSAHPPHRGVPPPSFQMPPSLPILVAPSTAVVGPPSPPISPTVAPPATQRYGIRTSSIGVPITTTDDHLSNESIKIRFITPAWAQATESRNSIPYFRKGAPIPLTTTLRQLKLDIAKYLNVDIQLLPPSVNVRSISSLQCNCGVGKRIAQHGIWYMLRCTGHGENIECDYPHESIDSNTECSLCRRRLADKCEACAEHENQDCPVVVNAGCRHIFHHDCYQQSNDKLCPAGCSKGLKSTPLALTADISDREMALPYSVCRHIILLHNDSEIKIFGLDLRFAGDSPRVRVSKSQLKTEIASFLKLPDIDNWAMRILSGSKDGFEFPVRKLTLALGRIYSFTTLSW
jgi:hypothetical protein